MITAELRRAILAVAGPDQDPQLRPGPAPGSYTSSLPFRLGPGPRHALAARLAGEPWIATAGITSPGYLTVTVTHEALASLAVRVTRAGPACAASDALRGRTVPGPATADLTTAPDWPSARAALAAEVTARLAATAGAAFAFAAGRWTQAVTCPQYAASPAPLRAGSKDGGVAVLRVGLTGGIGSGKSEVARRLVAHGAVLIDADVAAREVVVPGSRGLNRIVAAFGADVLGPDGSLDRARLGEIVFGDPELRTKLNAIVHPLVREWMGAAERTAVQAADPPGPIVVHDVPLLAESRGKGGFDLIIVVDVPPELQIERLVSQRGMVQGQARARMEAQASREKRLQVADVVIDNSGSLDDLDHRVAGVWADLERRAGA